MSITRSMTCLGFACCVALAAPAVAQTKASPKADKKPEPTITLTTKPTPAAAGDTTFTVVAKDAEGKAMMGADVSVEFVMPPMGGMAEMKNKVTLKPATDLKLAAEGTYTGQGQIMMAGRWNVTVSVKVGNTLVAEKKLTVTAR